ncbi:cytochrome P450 [Ephemerocybe angulata]|uniref:Cytochrome P450 n=1 Tax=Ephemerocybe angulata TaxID=980116 RepID=A0A8H6IC06_9AGAR|nr:cytochrome P450 [Tulosesus angulatus]
MHSLLVTLTLGLTLLLLRILTRTASTRYNLPPGPQGGFILGMRRLLPSVEPWKTYARWSQVYGDPVMSFRVYNRHIVVLNSAEAISDLLETKAEIYSDRPMSWMYNVICDRGRAIFNISSSNPRHKQYRKTLQSGLGLRATREYLPLIQQESLRLALGLIQSPEQLVTHVQRNSAAVIMKVAFGYTITDDDPFIKVADEASRISGWATQPGRWLVDHHPIIRFFPSWLPGMGWKRQGLAWRARLRYLAEVPHQWLQEKMASGTHTDCFTSRLLSPDDGNIYSALYAGAGDTTVSAIISFVLLMALHPEVQDDVDLNQISRLPYLNAIMKEVLRFAPVGNMALPHRVTEEDVYRGYRIPKDASIIANVWAVLHDPSIYPEPFTFSPERFMPSSPSNSERSTPQPDSKQWSFGFGKRACPGKRISGLLLTWLTYHTFDHPGIHFAETTMLFAMFNILLRCKISLPSGATKPVEVEFTTGITSHIKLFPIVVEPIKTT